MSKKPLVQQGNKSIYIEENTGKIEIHTPTGVEIINAFNPLELEKLKADFKDRFEEILGLLRGQLNHRIIRHHLTSMPFMLDDFIGRQQELKKIEQSLFSETGNILLLVNGRGGVGKTTLAARYYYKNHHKYAHVAWVLSERSITDAILNLAFPLQAKEVLQLPRKQALQEILRRMAELPKPCLLVIDNANELEDLQTSYESLRKCPNFHLLLTTRIRKFTGAKMHEIKGLPYSQALKLFERHYQELHSEEQKIFKGIHQAINHNTLIVEILAKNLATVNEYDDSYQLKDLLHDLQNRGLLALRQTEHIALHYHEYQRTKPEDIIYQMYELSPLQAGEKALLSVFAVLPPEGIALQQLQDLLPSFEDLKNHLRQLDHKGWIEFSKEDKKFKCSPVIQEVVRKRNDARLLEDIAELLKSLNTKLRNDGTFLTGSSYEEAALLSQYGGSILLVPAKNNTALKLLSERLGTYYRNVGQLEKALHYFQAYQQRSKALLQQQADNESHKNNLAISFARIGAIYTNMGQLHEALQAFEQYQKLQEALHHDFPENETFKNGLAIAFSKLGDTHTTLGNLNKALAFFEKDAQLTQELYDDFPQNVNFKHELAIAFERLGQTHTALGNLDKALAFFEKETVLFEQLYEDFPQNVHFKNGLAVSYFKLGAFYRDHQKDVQAAKSYFVKARQHWVGLTQLAPQYAQFQKFLGIVNDTLDRLS
ncbi:MAG: NB-ARC domain-containing protein [Saprospiraceae bacterium]|nr:NB-ARC domain-containing protein [Saprospiraceae bacterium]